MFWLFVSAWFVMQSSDALAQDTCSLPIKWVTASSNEYGISSGKTDFHSARKCCGTKGPDYRLAVFADGSSMRSTLDDLRGNINGNDEFWVGACRLEEPRTGNYTWSNGRLLLNMPWGGGEPDNGEDVARLDVDSYSTPVLRGTKSSTTNLFSFLCQHITNTAEIFQGTVRDQCVSQTSTSSLDQPFSTSIWEMATPTSTLVEIIPTSSIGFAMESTVSLSTAPAEYKLKSSSEFASSNTLETSSKYSFSVQHFSSTKALFTSSGDWIQTTSSVVSETVSEYSVEYSVELSQDFQQISATQDLPKPSTDLPKISSSKVELQSSSEYSMRVDVTSSVEQSYHVTGLQSVPPSSQATSRSLQGSKYATGRQSDSVVSTTAVQGHALGTGSEAPSASEQVFPSTLETVPSTQMATYLHGTFSTEWTYGESQTPMQATQSLDSSVAESVLGSSLHTGSLNTKSSKPTTEPSTNSAGLESSLTKGTLDTILSTWTIEPSTNSAGLESSQNKGTLDTSSSTWTVEPSTSSTAPSSQRNADSLLSSSQASVSEKVSNETAPFIVQPTMTPMTVPPLVSITSPSSLGENALSQSCTCACGTAGPRNETELEVLAKISHIQGDLAVNKSLLSRTVRKKISANDKRRSARAVGCSGLLILISVLLFIASLDLMRWCAWRDARKTQHRKEQ